jgi:hypothetical protein
VVTPVVVYVVGVAIGLWRVDAAPATRLGVALLWPLGLAAAVVTVSALVLAALLLFPVVGVAVVLAAVAMWWLAG